MFFLLDQRQVKTTICATFDVSFINAINFATSKVFVLGKDLTVSILKAFFSDWEKTLLKIRNF